MHRCLGIVAVLASGCASTAVPLDELVAFTSPDTPVDTAGLTVGNRVGMLPWRVCPLEVYSPGASVTSSSGQAANNVFPRGTLSRLTVTGLLVDPERATALIADVVDEHGTPYRLAVKTGEQVDCLVGWNESLERLHALIGTMVSFRPDGAECTTLALRGDGARRMLEAGSGERSYEVTALTVNDSNGTATPWLRIGDLEVRSDVLASCFAPAGGTSEGVLDASSTPRAASFEHLAGAYPGTCRSDRDSGVECVSSLGVWQGKLRDDRVELRRVRRTLGAVLMRDGAVGVAPVRERVLVAVPQVHNQRIATVRQGVTAGVANLAAHPIAGVAIAAEGEGEGDLRIDVELKDLTLGRLSSGRAQGNSEYVLRYEDKYNPDYEIASAAAVKAHTDREVASSQYQTALSQFENTKKMCQAAGNEAKKLMGGSMLASLVSAAGEAGCDIALAPSNEAVIQAEVAMASADATLASTPKTVRAPIMAPWTYEKTTYHRAVAVKLVLKIKDAKTSAVETRIVAVEHVWDDFTAIKDEAHNVDGHDVTQAMLSSGDGLLPDLAMKVETALRATLSQRVIELGMGPVRVALQASLGVTAGEQLVDSGAYLVARERLRASLAHGEVTVSAGKATTVTLGALAAQPHACLMVVALPGDLSKRVTLAAQGGAVADQRGAVPAFVEVCGDAARLDQIEVTSDGDGTVRWAAYATGVFESTVADVR